MESTTKNPENETEDQSDRLTDITVLLDRTGSMGEVKQQTISGFNEFLTGQRTAPGKAALTLIQFDSHDPHELCGGAATPIQEVAELTEATYQPRATTPLWDALGMAIVATDTRLKSAGDSEFPDDVLFVVVTDGYENASNEFRNDQVIKMVSRRENECGWKFIYIGADIDTFGRGNIGSHRGRSMPINKMKMQSAMSMSSRKMAEYRKSRKEADLVWSDNEREELS